jgi:cytosine/adenosine deaminase-related metal-dependent hydrolase
MECSNTKNIKIMVSDYLYTPEGFLSHHAVAFDSKIKAIDTLENLQKNYPHAECITMPPHTILYPGFINTHVHLEFSANKTTLKFGEFHTWLDSVIAHRDALVNTCTNAIMQQATQTMLHSGVTTFGAISSFGSELEVCEQTPQRVVFFNELIGSNAMFADALYGDFLERLKASQNSPQNTNITPAIAIHSPYSVHPVLLHKAIDVAKQYQLPLSAHFLESPAERQWLNNANGPFLTFFQKYFNTTTPVTTIEEFITAFDTYPTLFTHATQATQEELTHLASKGHTITHCPKSNRYLGCGRLNIETLPLPFTLGTDGLSSNDSLSLLEEMRAALFVHDGIPLQTLAIKLIESVTAHAADALKLPIGRIEKGKKADFALFTLPNKPLQEEDLALWTLLHARQASALYIDGEAINLV